MELFIRHILRVCRPAQMTAVDAAPAVAGMCHLMARRWWASVHHLADEAMHAQMLAVFADGRIARPATRPEETFVAIPR